MALCLFSHFCITARNSMNSHIIETTHGLSTIHSTCSEKIFMREHHRRLHLSSSMRDIYLKSLKEINFIQQILGWIILCSLMLCFNFIEGLFN